jgi:hypothetical protein
MKNYIKTMFVILATVMSFVAAQADWAEASIVCDEYVQGTALLDQDGYVTVDGNIFYGIPREIADSIDGKEVEISYGIQLCGEYVACSITIPTEDAVTVIVLRADKPDQPGHNGYNQ